MYGPLILDENGKKHIALLMAFLDDATRWILYGRFSFSEKSILFERGIKHILQSQGMMGRLYTDYGSGIDPDLADNIFDPFTQPGGLRVVPNWG